MTLQTDLRTDLPQVASDVVAAPPAGRRPDIQGLRAVAVALVVAFHAGLPLPGGFIGVDMFFVISGFVIAGMLLRELQRTSTIAFAAFYTRRMRRILPALALAIVVVAVGGAFLLSPFGPQQVTARTGIAASLFSANLQLSRAGGGGYFDLAAGNNALLHTWSLSVEEQFYLLFPALLLATWRVAGRRRARRSRRRTMAALVLVATAASFALSCYTTFNPPRGWGSEFAFYSPLTRAWEFGAGVLLALGVPILVRLTRRLAGALGVVGVLLVGIGAVTFTGTTAFPGFAVLLPVVGTALILAAGTSTNRGVTSMLGTRPAVWVGDISYGWYLWHWPLIVFAAAVWPHNSWILVVAALGSLAPTWLSYRLLENPIRFNQHLTGRRIVPLVAACITIPVVACLSLQIVSRAELGVAAVQDYTAVAQSHGEANACDTEQPIGGSAGAACTRAVDGARGTVVLVGDSNAGQFTEPVAKAANELGYDYTTATMGGCPFADLIRESRPPAFDGPTCHRFVAASVAGLRKSPPALVIVAISSSQLVNAGGGYLRDPRSGETASTPTARAKLYERGLASVLAALHDAGIPTLVVNPVPHLGETAEDWQGATCPFVRISAGACGASIGRPEVERQQQLARTAENRAVATVPGAASVDFTDTLCSAEKCATTRDGLWLYRDAAHLSVDGALTLTDRFRQLIVDHAVPR